MIVLSYSLREATLRARESLMRESLPQSTFGTCKDSQAAFPRHLGHSPREQTPFGENTEVILNLLLLLLVLQDLTINLLSLLLQILDACQVYL